MGKFVEVEHAEWIDAPVATVRGYAELFRLGAEHRPDDLAKSMARIESEATRMGKLVDEMLLLARLDQGYRFESDIVDLTVLPAAARVVRLGRTTFYQRAQRRLRLTGSAEAD